MKIDIKLLPQRLPIRGRNRLIAYHLMLWLLVIPSVIITSAATAGAVLFGLQALAPFVTLWVVIACFLLTTLLWAAIFGQSAIEALHRAFTDRPTQNLLNEMHKFSDKLSSDEDWQHWRKIRQAHPELRSERTLANLNAYLVGTKYAATMATLSAPLDAGQLPTELNATLSAYQSKLKRQQQHSQHWLVKASILAGKFIGWGVALIAEGAGVAFGCIAIVVLAKKGLALSVSQAAWLAGVFFLVGVTTMVLLNYDTIAFTFRKSALRYLKSKSKRHKHVARDAWQTVAVIFSTVVVASFYFFSGKTILPDLAKLVHVPKIGHYTHLNTLLAVSSLVLMLIGNFAFYGYFTRQHNKTPKALWSWSKRIGYSVMVGIPIIASLSSFLYFLQADNSVLMSLFHSHTIALMVMGVVALPALYMFALLFKSNGDIIGKLFTDTTSRTTAQQLMGFQQSLPAIQLPKPASKVNAPPISIMY